MSGVALSRRKQIGVVTALFVVTVFNYMDRSIIAVLLDGIGREFGFNDTELGLLSGLPFALLYALVGLPFARVADFWNRRLLIVLAVAGWSLATALCGLATGFWTLFMLRVCVGIGEGAGTPATHSVVADSFPPERRAGAAAMFALAASVGALLGYGGGGILADIHGWRWAFVIVGLPGVLAAGLAWLLIPETRVAPRLPTRSELAGAEARAVLRRLTGLKAYLFLIAGFTTAYFVQMGLSQWLAVFLIRDFAMTTSEVGVAIGGASAIGAALGSVAGGMIGNRLAARDVAWLLRLPAICAVLLLPGYAGLLLVHDKTLAVGLIFLASIVGGAMFGPVFAAMYGLSSSTERATAIALTAISTNIVGLGLGPVMVGALSDILQPSLGEASLRSAMLIVTMLLIPATLLFHAGSRHIKAEWWHEPDDRSDNPSVG